MANENVFLLYALLMGIFITFIYDILRIFRRVVPHGELWVSFEDIAFWIYCAAKVFLLMYHESDGTLRWFAVLGALVGMMAYKKLVSPFLVKYVSLLLRKILQALAKAGAFLLKPVGKLWTRMQIAISKASAGAMQRKRRKEGRKRSHFMKKKLTYLLKVLKMMV